MREYELTVVYDLAVAEAGGPEASVEHLTNAVQGRGGGVVRVDHWGRRRLAYPIGRSLDGDYVVTRVELDPAAVKPLEAQFMIDERVLRHLIVRADELPQPRQPKEPRVPAAAETPAAVETPAAGSTPVAAAEASEPVAPAAPVDEVAAEVHAVADAAPDAAAPSA
ncbi:hypothetical protein AYO38_08665 [bacterium SCGC AG-212-C10]|nr:hypothetical protein AYO38_08665 [bacterium SCGC AG-212-C10]